MALALFTLQMRCYQLGVNRHTIIDVIWLNCEPIEHMTDLVVKYSPSLNFSEHAGFIIAKARKMASFIPRNFTTSEVRIALFNMCKTHSRI